MEDERPARHGALERLQELVGIAEARGRDDLVTLLREVADRLIDTAVTVVVVGEFKQGKSSLVNALLGADVCSVDDALATSTPTFVRYAEEPFVRAMFGSRLEHRTPDEIAALTIEEGTDRPTSVLIGMPAPLLERGLVLVDTPGIGGLDSRSGAATLGVLGRADAVLFVTDASQELTAEELEFLQTARERCSQVALVLTKVDVNAAWRKVHALDAEHLERAGVDDVPILAAASALLDLGAESGIDAVLGYLDRDVVGRADAVVADAAVTRLREIANHLDAGLVAELRSLDDGGATVAALEAAVARSERLQSAGSRWRVALDDGFVDIASDLEHEVRTVVRALYADAEAAIDKADPAQTWGELEPWLNRRMMTDVMGCYAWLERRLSELAAEIDGLFRIAGEDVVSPLGLDLTAMPAGVHTLDGHLRTGAPNLAKEAYTALRGLQGGVMLFGVVAQIAGLALTGPAVVVFGVVMGGRSLREERRKQLALRKQKAKVPVRKWLDDVQSVASRDLSDRLREVQRTLRDGFDEQATSLARSTEEALQAARRAANIEASGRDRRRAEVDRQRAAIERVRVTLVASAG